MRPSVPLWQRLYLRPDPHQHGSFAAGSVCGAWVMPERLRAAEQCAPQPGGLGLWGVGQPTRTDTVRVDLPAFTVSVHRAARFGVVSFVPATLQVPLTRQVALPLAPGFTMSRRFADLPFFTDTNGFSAGDTNDEVTMDPFLASTVKVHVRHGSSFFTVHEVFVVRQVLTVRPDCARTV